MKSVRKFLSKLAAGIAKEFAPEYAGKFLLGTVKRYSFTQLAELAEQRRSLFRERWNRLKPWQQRKIRNFFSHMEREVRPVLENPATIREWLSAEAKRICEKEKKTQDDHVEIAYINFVLNSPKVFSWICWMAEEAAKLFFDEEPSPPTPQIELTVEEKKPEGEELPEPEVESEPVPRLRMIIADREEATS